MAHLIKDYPNLIQSGDKLVELVHLKQVKGTTPPVRSKSSNDPYVRRSELKRELNALETRIKVEFNAKFDEVNTRIDKLDSRILNIESILHLILNKLDIRQ